MRPIEPLGLATVAEAHRRAFAARLLASLAFVVLSIASTFLELGSERSQISYFNRDAVAWEGHAWSLVCGQIAGRDYVSTYGPAAQALAWLAVQLHRHDDYLSSPPRIDAVFRWCAILAMGVLLAVWPFQSAMQVCAAAASWWFLGLPWHYAVMRPAISCVALLLCIRLLRSDPPRSAWTPALAGFIAFGPSLLTPDMGVFTVASVAVVALSLPSRAAEARWVGRGVVGRVMTAVLVAVGFLAALAVAEAVFAASSSPAARRPGAYVAETWRMMSTYSLTVGKTWTDRLGSGWDIAGFLLATWVAIVATARNDSSEQRRKWVALGSFSLFGLVGGLIRCDPGHVALGLTPAVLALGFATPQRLPARSSLPWLLALFLGLASWPKDDPSQALGRLGGMASSSYAAAWSQMRDGEAPGPAFPKGVLEGARESRGPLLPHPWQNHLGPATGRCLAQRIDQTYKAHDLELQRRQVMSIEAADGGVSVWMGPGEQLDGVQDASRSPVVLEHLLEAFTPVAARDDVGAWIELRRRSRRRGLTWSRLAFELERGAPLEPTYRSREPITCGLLRLELAFLPSRWSPGLKAQRVAVQVRRGDEILLKSVLVPLTKSGRFETLLETKRNRKRAWLFGDSGEPPGTAFDALAFAPEPGDLWTRELREIRLLALDCLASERLGD